MIKVNESSFINSFQKEFTMIVGKTYLTRGGEKVQIVMQTGIFDKGHDMFRPFVGSNGQRYTEDGMTGWCCAPQTMDDLVAEYTTDIAVNELIITIVRSVGNLIMRRFTRNA
jgi:hypothetical protein